METREVMLVVAVTLALLLRPLKGSSLFCWALGSAGVAKVLLPSAGDQGVLQQQSYSAHHTQGELCVGERLLAGRSQRLLPCCAQKQL